MIYGSTSPRFTAIQVKYSKPMFAKIKKLQSTERVNVKDPRKWKSKIQSQHWRCSKIHGSEDQRFTSMKVKDLWGCKSKIDGQRYWRSKIYGQKRDECQKFTANVCKGPRFIAVNVKSFQWWRSKFHRPHYRRRIIHGQQRGSSQWFMPVKNKTSIVRKSRNSTANGGMEIENS